MDIVLFGIQGSGKGTQAKRLVAEFNYYHFEAGGELRKIAATGSTLGNEVKAYIDAGHLVPHDIIMAVVREAIGNVPADQPILFDGVPRDTDQQRDFDAIMAEAGRSFTGVQILLDEEVAFGRILERAKLEGRADDSDETKIRRRMGIFTEKTMPVIKNYDEEGLLWQVDGTGSVDDVYNRLESLVQSL